MVCSATLHDSGRANGCSSRRLEPGRHAVILTFEDEGGQTKYTACVRHWTVADRETHEKMSFHQGWGICADQLAALVEKV